MTTNVSMRDRCSLTIPNDMGYLSIALMFVRNVAEHLGFTEADLRRIELAVEEAVSNVIKHAFPADVVASFDITCSRIAGNMEVCIHDKGIPWDPTLDQDYHPEAGLDQQTGRGLGEFLIKRLMDEYSYSNLGQDGKQVRLVKYLDCQHIGEEVAHEAPRQPSASIQARTEQIEYQIRAMRPKEAVEVSRAVFAAYGYSYASDFVYYPERIAAMNESGKMLSAVAVVKDTGEVAGHNALMFSDELPPELAIAVTKHKFRGQGIASRLGKFLVDQARDMGLEGMYTKEVSVHPYTQRFVHKLGFRDCGMLLAHSPKTLSFKGIMDEASQRNSDVIGFQPIGVAEPRQLYIPEQHAGIIASIYAELDIPLHQLNSESIPGAEQKTVLKAVVNSARSLCEIHIPAYGDDLVGMLKQELRRVRRHEVQLVEMYLNLTDPSTPWVVSEAENLGFFFTGIMPATAGGDAIMLQYFNGIQVEYDALVIERPNTRALMEYIKAQDPTMA